MPRTQAADDLHAMKYRARGEDFREAMNRVAFGLKDDDRHYHNLREILMDQRFLPGGRIQGTVGSIRYTTAFNCFVSGTIADSYTEGAGSIMHRAHEAAATMRMGGGIGYDFSTLRPRGSLIKKLQSQSTGPINFMRIFNEICLCTASSGHRRGAQMGVLRCDHPDIQEFILAKQNTDQLTGFNVSIAVSDAFMEAVALAEPFDLVFNGVVHATVDAAELWERIMRSTWDWAEPGVLFIDRMNRNNNLWYCETISATNPCFTGDTLVWTANGHIPFRDLALSGKDVSVLSFKNGRFVYRTMHKPRLTGRRRKLVEIVFRRPEGKKTILTKVRCTPSHVFYLRNGTERQACNLKKGDRITSVYRRDRGKGYLGLNNHKCSVMEHHVPFENVVGLGTKIDVHHVNEDKHDNRPANLKLKGHGHHSSEHKMGDKNPMRQHPELSYFRIKDNHGANNGMYGRRHSESTLSKIGNKTVERFSDPEFRRRHSDSVRAGMSRMTPEARARNHVVVSVRELDELEDVYCGAVDDTHSFFVATGPDEGVLVHNCSEQPLPPYGACLLGSWNLVKFLNKTVLKVVESEDQTFTPYTFDFDRLKADIPPVVRAMDNVTDRTRYPLAEQKAEALTKRRMGIGVTGLANAAEACGHTYGSPEFCEFAKKILTIIRDESYRASVQLAQDKAPFPLFDAERYCKGEFIKTLPDDIQHGISQHGIRNSHLTSIAPTGTISMAADNVSSSIEPVFAYEIQRPINTPDGVQNQTIQDYGAEFLNVKGKLAADVTAEEHVRVLTTTQKLVDSAVSKTVNMDGRFMSWSAFKDIYRKAWEAGAKGCSTFNIAGKRTALLTDAEGSACQIDIETGRRECS